MFVVKFGFKLALRQNIDLYLDNYIQESRSRSLTFFNIHRNKCSEMQNFDCSY